MYPEFRSPQLHGPNSKIDSADCSGHAYAGKALTPARSLARCFRPAQAAVRHLEHFVSQFLGFWGLGSCGCCLAYQASGLQTVVYLHTPQHS